LKQFRQKGFVIIEVLNGFAVQIFCGTGHFCRIADYYGIIGNILVDKAACSDKATFSDCYSEQNN
jgi:hypothetical protein